jgi:hypothetical protein
VKELCRTCAQNNRRAESARIQALDRQDSGPMVRREHHTATNAMDSGDLLF